MICRYVVSTKVSVVVSASNAKEADKKATEYFDKLLTSGIDVDLDGEYDIEAEVEA